MLNKVMIIGRLGKDPETRYTQGGSPICNLTVATDESYKDQSGNVQSRVEWHKIVVFSRAAENCQNYLKKGSLVYVEGSLQTREWQDQNGQKRYTTEIKAQRVQFLDRRNEDHNEFGPRYPQQTPAQPVPPVTRAETNQQNPFFNSNDDIPF